MFAKTRKEKFVEQAQELASDLSEALTPHVEKAKDELAPRIAGAREQAAPHVEAIKERIANDVVPKVQQVVSDAREQAGPVAEEARRRGTAAAAALKGEDVEVKQAKKGGKLRKLLLLVGLAGLGAFVAKKLKGDDSSNWQSSYTPSPAPAAPPAPPSPAAPMAGSHVADVPTDAGTTGSGDAAGAAPGESLSDAVEEPHPVTTPDNPAEKTDVSDVEDPKA